MGEHDMTGEMTPERYREVAAAVEAAVQTVIVGQDALVRMVLTCLLCEGHALVEGVPGLGKTQLLTTLTSALDLRQARVQCTPDLLPADIIGAQILSEDGHGRRSLEFRPGPVFTNLLLADEVNRATPRTQAALLEAMAERRVTTSGATRDLPRPFFVMATQNPVEMEGTYPLPEAQLDRFLLKAIVPFPTAAEVTAIVLRTTGAPPPPVAQVTDAATVAAMIALTRQVPIANHLAAHAADLVIATQPSDPTAPDLVRRYVRFGASPRGAQALVLSAKATALLDGRPSVSAADVRANAHAAFRHRLVLGYEAVVDGVAADTVVDAVLAAVPAPGVGIRGAP